MPTHKLECCNCAFDVILSQAEYAGLKSDEYNNKLCPIYECELEETPHAD